MQRDEQNLYLCNICVLPSRNLMLNIGQNKEFCVLRLVGDRPLFFCSLNIIITKTCLRASF